MTDDLTKLLVIEAVNTAYRGAAKVCRELSGIPNINNVRSSDILSLLADKLEAAVEEVG